MFWKPGYTSTILAAVGRQQGPFGHCHAIGDRPFVILHTLIVKAETSSIFQRRAAQGAKKSTYFLLSDRVKRHIKSILMKIRFFNTTDN